MQQPDFTPLAATISLLIPEVINDAATTSIGSQAGVRAASISSKVCHRDLNGERGQVGSSQLYAIVLEHIFGPPCDSILSPF